MWYQVPGYHWSHFPPLIISNAEPLQQWCTMARYPTAGTCRGQAVLQIQHGVPKGHRNDSHIRASTVQLFGQSSFDIDMFHILAVQQVCHVMSADDPACFIIGHQLSMSPKEAEWPKTKHHLGLSCKYPTILKSHSPGAKPINFAVIQHCH